MLSISTLRRKAYKAGYRISKGLVHYTTGAVYRDSNGNGEVGYNIIDMQYNCYVAGSCNQVYDHQLSLDEVNDFISELYND